MKTQGNTSIKGIVLASFIVKYLIDYPINALTLNILGFFFSLIVIFFINLFVCILFIKIYDKQRLEGKIIIFLRKQMKKNKIISYIIFSIKNPFILIICLREGLFDYAGFERKRINILTFITILWTSIGWNILLYTGFSFWDFLKTL